MMERPKNGMIVPSVRDLFPGHGLPPETYSDYGVWLPVWKDGHICYMSGVEHRNYLYELKSREWRKEFVLEGVIRAFRILTYVALVVGCVFMLGVYATGFGIIDVITGGVLAICVSSAIIGFQVGWVLSFKTRLPKRTVVEVQ